MKFFKNEQIFKNNDYFIFLPNFLRIEPLDYNLDINLEDILFVEKQKKLIFDNTNNFLENKDSNNILLWGARGMGKSSLVKCIIKETNKNSKKKIKLIEILSDSFKYLPEIIYELRSIKNNFILFIDDITFESSNSEFSLFKSVLDGSILSNSKNIRFYVTSNLRHLSNKDANLQVVDDLSKKEIYSNLIALSDRFGFWIGFHENDKKKYLDTVIHYAKKNSLQNIEKLKDEAFIWSTSKGNFSGRTAFQFVKNIKS